MKGLPFPKALSYVYRLLAIRARSEKEIISKLRGKGCSAECRERILEKLKDVGYIDDAQFAQDWIKGRYTVSPRGALVIREELRKKGIDEGIIEDLMNDPTSGYDECEAAKAFLDKRSYLLKGLDAAERKKRIYGYLARRGFSFDIINDIIDKA